LVFIDNKSVDSDFLENFSDFLVLVAYYYKFHIELEQKNNPIMPFRMMKYEITEALSSSEAAPVGEMQGMKIPEGAVIYWEKNSELPDSYELYVEHASVRFTYPVKVIKFADFTLQELIDNDLILLVPLYPSKFRKKVEKLSDEGMLPSESKSLIKEMFSDIIDAISECHDNGKIERFDAGMLVSNTIYIYNYLYSNYHELRRDDMEATEYKWIAPALADAKGEAIVAKSDAATARGDAAAARGDAAAAKDLVIKLNEELKKTQEIVTKLTEENKKIIEMLKNNGIVVL
jgi:hypothetical protein